MKTTWITAAAGLLAIGMAAFFLTRPDDSEAQSPKPGSAEAGKGKPKPGSGQTPDARHLREETKEAREADKKAATDLELLWARGDEKETLDALDKIGSYTKADEWGAIGEVLIQKAATESRPDLINYLLATGDAAPMKLRQNIYASALDNKAPGVAASAKLELQNLTGKVFASGDEARAWIKANTPEEEEEETGN
jgi:hypothetical protein